MLKKTIERIRSTICLKEFVVNHVLTKNVTVPSPQILNEHFYTLEELTVIFNINRKNEELFKSIILEEVFKENIHSDSEYSYYSLFAIINCDELLHKISPLTNFVETIKI